MVSLEQIGILDFKSYNLKGKLFEREEDFKVQEIEEDGTVLNLERKEKREVTEEKKDYLLFTLVKRGISTPEAIKLIARNLHISFKRIAYNGNKDKRALTSQRISIFKFDAENLSIDSERMFFRDLTYSNDPCKIGKLYGNHFTVIVKEFDASGDELNKITQDINKGVPNFYGPQRFGSASLNIETSKSILIGDFKSAFYTLVLKERNESEINRERRAALRSVFSGYLENGNVNKEDAEKALSALPYFMYFERDSLSYLMQHKNDYAGAIRLLPKYLRLMVLQSFQYYVFNKTLSIILKDTPIEKLEKEISTIGYDMDTESIEAKIAIGILKEEGIEDIKKLKLSSMPEASLKSFKHPSYFIPEGFNIGLNGNDAIISFNLKKGSYATILLLKLFGNAQ
jgi:tRNA pseudouridine13 synthase